VFLRAQNEKIFLRAELRKKLNGIF
jgi:hypothetical protein